MINVVMVTYNRKLIIDKCLDTILNQDFNEEFEIIVIDNCSCDGTEEFIKTKFNKRVKLIENKTRLNLLACKNLGLNLACGDIIAFIDDDCLASKDWLKAIRNSLTNYDFVGGVVLPTPDTKFPWWWRESLDWLIGINLKPNMKFLPLGSNIAFRRSALEKILNRLKLKIK